MKLKPHHIYWNTAESNNKIMPVSVCYYNIVMDLYDLLRLSGNGNYSSLICHLLFIGLKLSLKTP